MRDLCVVVHRREDRPRRAVDGLYLCRGCLHALGRHVADLPYLHDQLGRVLRRASTTALRITGGNQGLPINPAVADARSTIRGALYSWARVVAEDRGLTPPSGAGGVSAPTLHQISAWLLPHVTWCAGHRWVDEMAGELGGLVARAWALIEPHKLRVAELAPCPDCGDGMLGAVIRADGDPRPSLIFCDGCGTEYEPSQWRRLEKRLEKRLGRKVG